MSSVDVVVFGSLNLDLVVRTERLPGAGETLSGTDYAEYPGGKGLNQAVAAARAGAQVAMVGCVGDDEAGERLRAIVRSEGIHDEGIATLDDTPTGRAVITVDDAAENSIVIVPGANAGPLALDFPDARVVLAQLETPVAGVIDAFGRARSRGATTVLNPAPAIGLPSELIERCDVLVPNEHEVTLLGGRDVVAARVEHLVVTLGAAGADHVHGGATVRVEPFAVSPVDTTGAGDAFSGALASRIAAGDDFADALRFAAAAGALATTVPGAVPSQAHRVDIDALLAG